MDSHNWHGTCDVLFEVWAKSPQSPKWKSGPILLVVLILLSIDYITNWQFVLASFIIIIIIICNSAGINFKLILFWDTHFHSLTDTFSDNSTIIIYSRLCVCVCIHLYH